MKPYEVHEGDVMDVLPTLEAESFDAMLTDPPYGLEFMGRDWDRVVPGPDVWRECLRVLKPGAFALVFGGTRTFHRLAVALEDAGFEMRDTLMWIYGSGFPKSHNLSGEWSGYGTALKPAWEPVLLVRKPSPLTFAETALQHSTGALNIDACRVPLDGDKPNGGGKRDSWRALEGRSDCQPWNGGNVTPDTGRWPANLIHDGSPEVVERFPRSDARPNTYGATSERSEAEGYGTRAWNKSGPVYADTGSAARFFYTAKADRSERDAGLDHLPRRRAGMTSETSGQHITSRDEGYEIPQVANHHPTVKPLALTEYLARLLLPPSRDTPRRILTPFAGSGSEMIGALQAGWDETVGIEREREYVEIARARLEHFSRGLQPRLLEAV